MASNSKRPSTFDDGPRKKQALLSQPPTPADDVCARCVKVRWDELATGTWSVKQVMMVVESHDQLKTSCCRICRLLSTIKPPSLDGPWCVLLAHSARSVLVGKQLRETPALDSNILFFSRWHKVLTSNHSPENGVLGLSKSGQHFDVGIQIISPDTISFTTLQRCVARCQTTHKRACARSTHSSVSNLKVIDCEKQNTVSAPKRCKYAALSYVWGDASDNTSSNGYSKVVEDAIKATLKMGIRYLWVDRHVGQDYGPY
ncbi:hypothetical protein F4819DRAFT_454120, partial [Hypoxylon fuscum]